MTGNTRSGRISREESLFLTVSSNHRRRSYPEFIEWMSLPHREAGGIIEAYEGILLGGADLFFDLEELNLWIRRHKFAAFDMDLLVPVVHICLEYAIRRKLEAERPGIRHIAQDAAREHLQGDPLRFRSASRWWLRIWWICRQFPDLPRDPETQDILSRITAFHALPLSLFEETVISCADCDTARSLVEKAVFLYKEIFTRFFAARQDTDFLENIDFDVISSSGQDQREDGQPSPSQMEMELTYSARKMQDADELQLSLEELAAVPAYVEENFGPSFKKKREMTEIEQAVCTELHADRKLLFTDGLPESVCEEDSGIGRTYRASRQANDAMYQKYRDSARQSIRSLELAFRNARYLRSDPEISSSYRGQLNNPSLWKVGRVENPQLFQQVNHQDQGRTVVELLIDASGSQSPRQPMVALQSYVFSAALTRVGLPHRVMSYCTYGDHTILRRFRDYDDGPEADRRLFDYHATSNNRDGLALAAAGMDLKKRREENKILIVFSDGLPNDMVAGRVRADRPKKYIGDTAVMDTCHQVRSLRRCGCHVIGIFLGEDNELANERLIYGSSFIRIQRVEDFSGIAAKQLSEILNHL